MLIKLGLYEPYFIDPRISIQRQHK